MPSKSVITIAMTDGACAEEVARGAAQRLGYRYVNDQVIDRAAEQAGVDAKTLAAVEHSEPLVARILRGLALGFAADPTAVYVPVPVSDERPAYRALIQDVVRAVAAEGNVVIGAHGASVTLAGTPRLLRVFLTAPIETRIARVAAERNLSAAEARKEVEHTDRERKGYFERFFKLSAEQPTHYDLVVNTEVLSAETAVGLIATAAS
jgi:CMP/dCMP kinase